MFIPELDEFEKKVIEKEIETYQAEYKSLLERVKKVEEEKQYEKEN